jgi:hypothetical protein
VKLPDKVVWVDTVVGKWGVPTVIALVLLAAILGGIYVSVKWAALEVAKPLVTKHLEFLDEKIKEGREAQKTNQTIAESTKLTAESVKSMAASREESIKERRHQTEVLDSLNQQNLRDHKAAAEKLDSIDSKLKRP